MKSSLLKGLSIFVAFALLLPASGGVVSARNLSSAGVIVTVQKGGRFAVVGDTVQHALSIQNSGDLGEDTFDLQVSSSWPAGLFAADGHTALADTNSNGLTDTGPIPQGDTVTIVVNVQVPEDAAVGDENQVTFTATSAKDTGQTASAALPAVVPAPFVQAFSTTSGSLAENNLTDNMFLDFIRPDGQVLQETAADERGFYYASAVVEAPGGNLVQTWDTDSCWDIDCNYFNTEIEYTVLSHSGQTVHSLTKLNDYNDPTYTTTDSSPALAVAPDGTIGIAWVRRIGSKNEIYNSNVYLALLDSNGNLLGSEINLTNNSAWSTLYNQDAPYYSNVQVVATGDNRFFCGLAG